MRLIASTLLVLLAMTSPANAGEPPQPHRIDHALAKKFGGNENGMRSYILVILKTGSQRVPDGAARDEMFKGHFANIQRLAAEGKMVVAGPFGDKDDWRGMFILAVESPEQAQQLVATDPVIKSGEMIAEYHRLFASAALMGVAALHEQISPRD